MYYQISDLLRIWTMFAGRIVEDVVRHKEAYYV